MTHLGEVGAGCSRFGEQAGTQPGAWQQQLEHARLRTAASTRRLRYTLGHLSDLANSHKCSPVGSDSDDRQ